MVDLVSQGYMSSVDRLAGLAKLKHLIKVSHHPLVLIKLITFPELYYRSYLSSLRSEVLLI